MKQVIALVDTPNASFIKYIGFAKAEKPNFIFVQDSKFTNYIYNSKNL